MYMTLYKDYYESYEILHNPNIIDIKYRLYASCKCLSA